LELSKRFKFAATERLLEATGQDNMQFKNKKGYIKGDHALIKPGLQPSTFYLAIY